MIGVWFNGALMLVGGLVGRWSRWEYTADVEHRLRPWLGLFALYAAASACWAGVADAGLGGAVWRVVLLFVGLTIGRALGAWLGVQRLWSRMGRFANDVLQHASPEKRANWNTAFQAVTIVGCLSPLALAGPVLAGAMNDVKPLALKAVLDGLAMVSFARHLGWGSLPGALPVVVLQGTLFVLTRWAALAGAGGEIMAGLALVSGYLVLAAALAVFGVHRVRTADYYPAFLIVPLLFWGLG